MSNKNGIMETVLSCSYPVNMKEYVTNIVWEVVSTSSSKIFKIQYKNESIIMIKYKVTTKFKEKIYDVPILIYITKNIPYEPPDIFLDKAIDTGVNPKNMDVDLTSNKITTPSLTKWYLNNALSDVIREITSSFNKNFPIFKLNRILNDQSNQRTSQSSGNNFNLNAGSVEKLNQLNFYENKIRNLKNDNPNNHLQNLNPNIPKTVLKNTIFPKSSHKNQSYQTVYSTNGGNILSSNYHSYPNKQYQNDQITYNSYQDKNFKTLISINFNSNNNTNLINSVYNSKIEDEIKNILVREIKNKIEIKIKEEFKRNKQVKEKLTNYKDEFNKQIDKYQKFNTKKFEITRNLKSFLDGSEKQILNLQSLIYNMKDVKMNSSNFESSIYISNRILIQIIAIEATIEEYITIFKKSFEKNILNFNQTVKSIRMLSRELMKLKMCKEKLMKKL